MKTNWKDNREDLWILIKGQTLGRTGVRVWNQLWEQVRVRVCWHVWRKPQ